MNDTFVVVKFSTADENTASAISAVLSEYGFEGFEEEETGIKAFISEEQFEQINLQEIFEGIPAFQNIEYSVDKIEPVNWNEAWEKNFSPILISDRIFIRASFHTARNDVSYEIVIDPKMSFGTGHHATTYMMCELMLETDFKDKSVFDFGSGTGILSIAASKLGADSIIALDHEEWAYNNCIENCSLNHVTNVEVIKGNESSFPASRFDIILANINKNVICQNLSKLCSLLKSEGQLFISGFLKEDIPDILDTARQLSMVRINQTEKDGWICMVLTY
jgi:ribosomal protein L11 methyltransferase